MWNVCSKFCEFLLFFLLELFLCEYYFCVYIYIYLSVVLMSMGGLLVVIHCCLCSSSYYLITYLPHKAVAEVSKDKEPIGRERAEFNWFESQLMSDSNELRFKWFWLSVDLRFNWFGCQLIWDSNDLVVNRCALQMILVVCWLELQVMWLSIDLRFKWFGCQMIWGSSDLVVNWCLIQMILSNEAFVRDFLHNWSFEIQKRSISARLPSKTKLWRSKIELLCETSFKNDTLKLKNEAFVRDFLPKWSFEHQKRSISARRPSKMTCWPHAWPQNYNTF